MNSVLKKCVAVVAASAFLATANPSFSTALEGTTATITESTLTDTTTVTVTPEISAPGIDPVTAGLVLIPLIAGAVALNAPTPGETTPPISVVPAESTPTETTTSEPAPAPAPAVPEAPEAPQLANTGDAITQILMVAGAILALGIVLSLLRRRKENN
ncbi:MAG: LPXTG cell wall anchor domain-containing protein [Corynebacterium sp.]|nr:LPXTG cell wall anchor domain-containing protein [Corynebacterium sp.]